MKKLLITTLLTASYSLVAGPFDCKSSVKKAVQQAVTTEQKKCAKVRQQEKENYQEQLKKVASDTQLRVLKEATERYSKLLQNAEQEKNDLQNRLEDTQKELRETREKTETIKQHCTLETTDHNDTPQEKSKSTRKTTQNTLNNHQEEVIKIQKEDRTLKKNK